jgi:hypothetical protein
LGRRNLDSSVDFDPIRDHRADDSAGQLARGTVRLDLSQVAFQDRRGSALAEVRLEDGRQSDAAPGSQRADAIRAPPVSLRHRRSGP